MSSKSRIRALIGLLAFSPSYLLAVPSNTAKAPIQEIAFIDAVVASVDEQPITLSSVCKRLTPPRRLTLKDAAYDHEFKAVLDHMILEMLVQQEAHTRKIAVSSEEVDEYVDEIAKRNGLSRDEFVQALSREGRSIEEYRRDVELDIVRSKLASSLSRGAVAVSDEEVNQHLSGETAETPKASGAQVTLRQILVTNSGKSEEESLTKIEQARSRIEDGEDFAAVAGEVSESPEAADGGLLGTMSLQDINPQIYDSIYQLEPGQVSAVTRTESGYHIFKVDSRGETEQSTEEKTDQPSVDEEQRERIRESLRQSKLESKLAQYFTTELYKLHSVDKKI